MHQRLLSVCGKKPLTYYNTLQNRFPLQSINELSTFFNLTASTFYRYRLHRLTESGVSLAETSNWFSTYSGINFQVETFRCTYISRGNPCIFVTRLTPLPSTKSVISIFTVDHQPHAIEHIALLNIEVENKNVCELRAEIVFQPAEGNSGATFNNFHSPSCLNAYKTLRNYVF